MIILQPFSQLEDMGVDPQRCQLSKCCSHVVSAGSRDSKTFVVDLLTHPVE